MKAERREAQPQRRGDAVDAGDMRLQFRLGFVHRGQHRARKLKLPARLKRQRRPAALQADNVLAVQNRRQPLLLRRQQQIPDARPVFGAVGRRGKCVAEEAKSLMLGADLVCGRRLAAGFQVARQVAHIGHNRRVRVSRVRQSFTPLGRMRGAARARR